MLSRVTRLRIRECVAEDGNLSFESSRDADPTESDRQRKWNVFGLAYSDGIVYFGGGWEGPARRIRTTEARLPLWMPFVLLSAYPAVTFFRGPLRRARRAKRGACPECGYDLTGNVSGVCPECGVEVRA